ncbi:hypothetical protein SAMD00019534_061380, partial [Acytostelium subglobosum LB1]|uniref:hypothetical protein n=1 Tax=Acytostelium subglobosum LB1 TaxID=1410327 RepID=UPI000644B3C7
YNTPLNCISGSIPDTVTSIKFGTSFNKSVDVGHLPPALTSLTLGLSFNRPLIEGSLPSTLTSLTFGRMFNQYIDSKLPDSITLLVLGGYGQPIAPSSLPQSLTSLTFGYMFNHEIEPGVLPPNLVTLRFGHHFSKDITPYSLPESLRTLTFGEWYAQPFQTGSLPPWLLSLSLGSMSPESAANCLPNSLTHLQFNERNVPTGPLPTGLKTLVNGMISHKTDMPHSLTKLKLRPYFNDQMLPFWLPQTLRNLSLGDMYTQELLPGTLPFSLTKLTMGTHYNKPIGKGLLPSSIISLTIGHYMSMPIVFPPNLRYLSMGRMEQQFHYLQQLPESIEEVAITHVPLARPYERSSPLTCVSPNINIKYFTMFIENAPFNVKSTCKLSNIRQLIYNSLGWLASGTISTYRVRKLLWMSNGHTSFEYRVIDHHHVLCIGKHSITDSSTMFILPYPPPSPPT